MKRLLTILSLIVCCTLGTMAQDILRIAKTDGSTLVLNVADINEMSFASVKPGTDPIALNVTSWCLAPKQQAHLEATTQPARGKGQKVNAEWSSSDPSVASVNQSGVVTGLREGETVITANYDGNLAQMRLQVKAGQFFDVNIYDIKANDCKIDIRPRDPSIKYYYNLRVTHDVTNMVEHGSMEENVVWFTWDWCDYVQQVSGTSAAEYLQLSLESGNVSTTGRQFYSSGLENGQEHTLYIMGFDELGQLSTPVELYSFTTPAVEQTDMTFDIELLKVLGTDAMFRVTPSDPTKPYLVCVQSAERFVDYYLRDNSVETVMAQKIIETYGDNPYYPSMQMGVSSNTKEGRDLYASDYLPTVRSNEYYYIIVFGYDGGKTTPVALKRFYTKYGWTEPERDIIEVTPPTGVTTHNITISFNDITLDDNDELEFAPYGPFDAFSRFKDGKLYIKNCFDQLATGWIVGDFDAAANTVTFPWPQLVGNFDFSLGDGPQDVYFIGAHFASGYEGAAEFCDLVFDYDPANYTLKSRTNDAVVVNVDPFDPAPIMFFGDYTIQLDGPLK